MTKTKSVHVEFEFNVDSTLSIVNVIRRAVSEFYQQILNNPETVSTLEIATHELLENAVRRATDHSVRLRIEAYQCAEREPYGVAVYTWNKATPENIKELQRLFKDIEESEDDPLGYYLGLMAKNAERDDISQLGLARVRAEGEMTLTLQVEGNLVCLIAKAQLEEEILLEKESQKND